MVHSSVRTRLCALLCLLALLLSGCSGHQAVTPHDAVRAMCHAEVPLPCGKIYVRSAPKDSAEHLSDRLLTAILGNGCLPPEIDLTEDIALFFSYTHPCELAVFLCKNADGTDAVAQLCLRRLDVLRAYWDQRGSEFAAYTDRAIVTVRGRWVILCVSSDPDAALRALRRTL